MTKKELGVKVGVSDKTVSAWENGTKMPRAVTMYELARIFNKPSDELFSCAAKDKHEKEPFVNSQKAKETLDIQRIVNAYCNASEEGKAMFRKLAELYL
jgi:DNA-binding XRE family transcriptional regulator